MARTSEARAAADNLLFSASNFILWTKRLILEEHGVEFSGFFTATVAALLVGKAVLVTDKLPVRHLITGSVSYWWNGGGDGNVHSRVVAPTPQGLAAASAFRMKA